jgi:hypothetical protein
MVSPQLLENKKERTRLLENKKERTRLLENKKETPLFIESIIPPLLTYKPKHVSSSGRSLRPQKSKSPTYPTTSVFEKTPWNTKKSKYEETDEDVLDEYMDVLDNTEREYIRIPNQNDDSKQQSILPKLKQVEKVLNNLELEKFKLNEMKKLASDSKAADFLKKQLQDIRRKKDSLRQTAQQLVRKAKAKKDEVVPKVVQMLSELKEKPQVQTQPSIMEDDEFDIDIRSIVQKTAKERDTDSDSESETEKKQSHKKKETKHKSSVLTNLENSMKKIGITVEPKKQYKGSMCKFIVNNTECRHKHCNFAHFINELQPCSYGYRCKNTHCRFIHPNDSLNSYIQRIKQ